MARRDLKIKASKNEDHYETCGEKPVLFRFRRIQNLQLKTRSAQSKATGREQRSETALEEAKCITENV